MPTELTEMLRAWIATVVREEVSKARVEATQHAASEYMTITEAAAVARVATGTIHRWIRAGRLRKHGAGAHARVARAELEKLMRPDGKRQSPRHLSKSRAGVSKLSPEEQVDRELGFA